MLRNVSRGLRAKKKENATMISRECRSGGSPKKEKGTHRFLSLFDASFNLLESALDLIIDDFDILLSDYGDGSLGGEFLGACPPHNPVPSHAGFLGGYPKAR